MLFHPSQTGSDVVSSLSDREGCCFIPLRQGGMLFHPSQTGRDVVSSLSDREGWCFIPLRQGGMLFHPSQTGRDVVSSLSDREGCCFIPLRQGRMLFHPLVFHPSNKDGFYVILDHFLYLDILYQQTLLNHKIVKPK